jgi:ABC-type transport system involved in cytochrome c biogenesis permease subunit
MKLFVLLTFFANLSWALEQTYFCSPQLEALPILEGGRLKPLYVTGEESLNFLTAKKDLPNNLTRTQAYCLLSIKALYKHAFDITFRAEHVKVQGLLGRVQMSYSQLKAYSSEIRMEYFKIKEKNSYKSALGKVLRKIKLYDKITSGHHWVIPQVKKGVVSWIPINSFFTPQQLSANPDSLLRYLEKSKQDFIQQEKSQFLFELDFLKWNIPVWSLLFTSLALIGLMVFKNLKIGIGLSAITFLLQTFLMVGRILISGRAPVTNMYETVMFSGFGALLLSGIICWFLKEKIYLYLGLGYNMCTLLMMNFATDLISPSISPLVPVLRDNFWLSTHVTSIVLSYGALALSWLLANISLVQKAFFTLSMDREKYYSKVIYNCLKFGTVTLFIGIMLGGVWADYSWGRFWGWDPKETWSLIVFCLYMAILHGKYTSWIPEKVFIPATAFAFLSVIMAWFGVNYILASGLHSYGFSQGGATFIGLFFLIQILLLMITSIRVRKKEQVILPR